MDTQPLTLNSNIHFSGFCEEDSGILQYIHFQYIIHTFNYILTRDDRMGGVHGGHRREWVMDLYNFHSRFLQHELRLRVFVPYTYIACMVIGHWKRRCNTPQGCGQTYEYVGSRNGAKEVVSTRAWNWNLITDKKRRLVMDYRSISLASGVAGMW